MEAYKADWAITDPFDNPIIDNRIVNDHTFALRLKNFISKVEVNDLPSEEEKEYLLHVADKLLRYQKLTVMTKSEKEYLKQNNI